VLGKQMKRRDYLASYPAGDIPSVIDTLPRNEFETFLRAQ
jgi:hypothetical protein